MKRIVFLSRKKIAPATALVVFASSLVACSPHTEDAASPNKPYAIALEPQRENIVITNNRESPQDRIKNRSITESIKRMREAYKLMPDRRFLLAIPDIDHLITGKPKTEVRVSHQNGEWTISYRDQLVGKIKDFASGADLFGLLSDWASSLKTKQGPEVFEGKGDAPISLDSMSPAQLFPLIAKSDDRDYRVDAGKMQNASNAATLLSSIYIDDTGIGDSFFARTLALQACSLRDKNTDSIRNECLLADTMHYIEYARSLSKRLAEDDPVRLYIQQDSTNLAKLCHKQNRPQSTVFLYLMVLAKNRDSSQWLQAVNELESETQSMALAVIRSACEFSGEKNQLPIGHYLMVATLRDLDKESHDKPIDFKDISWSYEKSRDSSEWIVEGMGKDFESTLQKSAGSKLRDSTSVPQIREDYYRAVFASGAYRMAKSYLELHADKKRLYSFANSIRVDKGALSDLSRWLEVMLKIRKSDATQEDTINDLSSMSSLGAQPLADIVVQSGSFAEASNPYILIPAGKRLFELADTRPQTRLRLARVADSNLLYPRLSHTIYLSILKNGSSTSLGSKIEQAIALGRQDDMTALLKTGLLSTEEELRILQRLKQLGTLPVKSLTALYRQAYGRHSVAGEFLEPYCRFLIDTKRIQEARQILEMFVSKNSESGTEAIIRAKSILASIALSEKRYDDGLKILTQLENTEQAPVLIMKARLLEGLGKREDAETWAKEALIRFPKDPNCISLNAELLWKNGKYDEAAALLYKLREFLSGTQWRDFIAPSFAGVFKSNPNAMLLAVGSLIDVNLSGPDTLGQLARAMYVCDHPEEAFTILSKVRQQSVDAGDLYTCAYRYLKRWRGESQALSWLSTGVRQQDRIKLAPYAFSSGQFELLWKLIPQTEASDDTERLWLMRTSACLVDSTLYAKYKGSLIDHFKNATGVMAELGQYMLGINKALPKSTLNERLTCISAFYLGWKILATGESFFDGTELYHLALETAQPALSEFQWSQLWLIDLMLMMQNNPAVMQSALYHRLRIVGPGKDGQFEQQRRFKISAF